MKNFKEIKNDIIFLYKNVPFPENLIEKDSLVFKTLIFNEKSETPESCTYQARKVKLSNGYIINSSSEEVRLKPRSASHIKPNNYRNGNQKNNNDNNNNNANFVNNNNNLNNQNSSFSPNNDTKKNTTEEEEKAKTNKKVLLLKPSEYLLCKENSLSIINFIFNEYTRQDKVVNLNNDLGFLLNFKNSNKNDTADNKIIKGIKFTESIINKSNTQNQTRITESEESDKKKALEDGNLAESSILNNSNISMLLNSSANLEIQNIFKINEFLNYPNEEPLWYIYQPLTKSSVGPLSSKSVVEMFRENILNLYSEIRFIDVFNRNKTNPFTYFKLAEILENEFQSFEMIRLTDNGIEKFKCPIDLDHKPPSALSKANPLLTKGETGSNVINSSNINNNPNLFNKSNKIQKGANFINYNQQKSEVKLIPIDTSKLVRNAASPKKEEKVKLNCDLLNSHNKKDAYNIAVPVSYPQANSNKEEKSIKDGGENQCNKNSNNVEVVYEEYNKNPNQRYDNNKFNYNKNNNYYHDNNQNQYNNQGRNNKKRYGSKCKKGSLPPKKSNFNYDNYNFDKNNQEDYYYEENYYQNKNYRNNKNYNSKY